MSFIQRAWHFVQGKKIYIAITIDMTSHVEYNQVFQPTKHFSNFFCMQLDINLIQIWVHCTKSCPVFPLSKTHFMKNHTGAKLVRGPCPEWPPYLLASNSLCLLLIFQPTLIFTSFSLWVVLHLQLHHTHAHRHTHTRTQNSTYWQIRTLSTCLSHFSFAVYVLWFMPLL